MEEIEKSWKEKAVELQGVVEKLAKKYQEECSLRRSLSEKFHEMKGNIRVFCRVRPTEKDITEQSIVSSESFVSTTVEGKPHTFDFDKVFDQNSSQQNVFEETEPMIVSVLDGYNVSLFAYGLGFVFFLLIYFLKSFSQKIGQTGSGIILVFTGIKGTFAYKHSLNKLQERHIR